MPKVIDESKQRVAASTADPRPLELFVCYSHRDERWRERLSVHLKPLERHYQMAVWSDKKILPGKKWKKEIREAIARADIAILLISPDFLASDFIATHELPPLLSQAALKGTTILPLIVSPSLFEDITELADFQAVNDAAKPLISLPEGEQEAQFRSVAKTVLAASTKAQVRQPVRTAVEEGAGHKRALPPAEPRTPQENFLAASDWPGLMKIGNWIFDGDRQRIIGTGTKTFLLSQNDYGELPFTVDTTLSFSNFVKPAQSRLGMNAGVVLGWNTRKELVVPYYYNILLTGSELIVELNGPHASDGRRSQHLTPAVPLSVVAGVPLNLSVHVTGQKLRVDVDGKQLIDVPHLAGMIGRVGLRPWRSQLECTAFVVAVGV